MACSQSINQQNSSGFVLYVLTSISSGRVCSVYFSQVNCLYGLNWDVSVTRSALRMQETRFQIYLAQQHIEEINYNQSVNYSRSVLLIAYTQGGDFWKFLLEKYRKFHQISYHYRPSKLQCKLLHF